MDFDIYRPYEFHFDQDVYIKELKKALDEHGKTKPADLNKLLKEAGVNDIDYETVKSYFYGRRVPPFDVFVAICKSLDLNADKIAIPQSVQTPTYKGELSDGDAWRKCWECFTNVFYPYESKDDGAPIGVAEYFNADTYESDVDEIAAILARYNYLMQKYHYAEVSEDEFDQLCKFSARHIVERRGGQADPQEVVNWIYDCEDPDIVTGFYNKYTLGFYGKSCHSLLEISSTVIDDKLIKYAAQLLPKQDKFGEVKV